MQRLDEDVKLQGINKQEIQDIFTKTLKEFKDIKTRIIYLDASYLYTFYLDDADYIRKLNLLMRYQPVRVREWHKLLERWWNDQTVRNNIGYTIKPIKISRTFDRVVNEGMEMIAQTMTGGDGGLFEFRSIGDGGASSATPGDTTLGNEIDRINVNETPDGGSLSRDGTTVYSVGNHAKGVPTPANNQFTECGMHDTDDPLTDRMLDHSIFEDPIPHTQNEDAPGSTTVIYQCSA